MTAGFWKERSKTGGLKRKEGNSFRVNCVHRVCTGADDRNLGATTGWLDRRRGISVLQQVPPGSYRALAFNRQPDELEFTNEEAMKKYEAKSQVIQLEAGEKQELRLPLNAVSD